MSDSDKMAARVLIALGHSLLEGEIDFGQYIATICRALETAENSKQPGVYQ